MPKRKRAPPARRKKQAVTITRSAATKAIIQRNASTSPLLKLPAEIREEILSLVVGHQFIHLDYLYYRRTFRHAICTAASSEYEAHEQFMTGYTHIPSDDSADFYSTTFKERHAHCKTWDRTWDLEDGQFRTDEERFLSGLKPKEERRKPMLDLRVLGACRQMYEEANMILWTTNTFSFEDGPHLRGFIQSLLSTQRNKLTRMHIDMAWDQRSADQWRKSLRPSLVSKLNALQTLHITFDQWFTIFKKYPSSMILNPSKIQQEVLNPLSAMQTLALKNVTVVIGDRLASPPYQISPEAHRHRWTIEQKREVAEALRGNLLNR